MPRKLAQFGWAGDLSQSKLGMSPRWGRYKLRASVFLELLLQAGQGDRMGKTIMKARKK